MGSVASAEPVNQEQSRKRYSLNRILHRVVGLVAALLMLWIAGTGTIMQLVDLKAIFTHEPQSTPTELSMQEGMYGPNGYAVIQVSDFSAAPFPKGFDINQGVGTVLQAAHTPQNQGGGAGSGQAAGSGGQGPGPNAAANSGDPGAGRRGGGGDDGARAAGGPGGSPAAGGRGAGGTGGGRPRGGGGDSAARAAGGPGSGSASAGGGPGAGGPEGGGGGRMQMSSDDRVAAIDKVVTLTADQKMKIKAIYDTDTKKAADLRASQDPDMRTKLMALRTDQNTHIEALLTADQKPKYDAYVASIPQGRGPGGGGEGAALTTGSPGSNGPGGARRGGGGEGAALAASGPRGGSGAAGGPGTGNPGGGPRDGGNGNGSARAAAGGPGGGGPGGGPRGGGQGGPQFNPMAWAELRMIDGVPIGQVMMGTRLEAFNALTGQPVTPVPPVAIPQGRGLPPSLRQKLKTLHRFWNRSDTPGVYFEFLAGLILLLLLLTGLVMYFRLLGVRARQGRWSLLWLTGGGWWRGLHRVISVLAAAFILCQAFSGTWIGFESSAGPLRRALMGPAPRPAAGQQPPAGQPAVGGQPAAGGQPGQAAGGPGGVGGGRGRRNPIDFIIPLRDAEVQDMTAVTLASMQELHPNELIKAIRLRIYGQVKQGVVISSGGDVTNQYVFNADTGAPDSLTEQGYPESNFPFGVQVHENIKHFHSGAMFGIPTRLMNLFAGFSLTFLSVSGLVMYFDMWRKRRKGGRNSLVWR
jgi:uncharacterized iron-regulated membrane protein